MATFHNTSRQLGLTLKKVFRGHVPSAKISDLLEKRRIGKDSRAVISQHLHHCRCFYCKTKITSLEHAYCHAFEIEGESSAEVKIFCSQECYDKRWLSYFDDDPDLNLGVSYG